MKRLLFQQTSSEIMAVLHLVCLRFIFFVSKIKTMSTAIKSFGQPSNLTVSAYENGNATVVSSFGPKSCLRLKADASMYSKSGGSVQIRGIGQKTFLHAKELFFVQPIEFRLRDEAGVVILPNQFCDYNGAAANTAGLGGARRNQACETQARNTAVKVLNGLHLVSNGWFKSLQNCVLSINGSSWQVQPSSMIDSFEKIFAENRFDEFGATACPPYTSACNPRGQGLDQPGVLERCQAFMKDLKVVGVTHAGGANPPAITDVLFSCDLVSRIPIGPLWYAAYPALSNTTENDIHCLPHVHDLSLEYTYQNEAPCQKWFRYPSTDARNSLAVDCSDLTPGNNVTANTLYADAATGGIDMQRMWDRAVSQEASILGDNTKYLNLKRPYLSYVITEVSGARLDYKPLYTIPSIRFTTYSQDQYIADGDQTNTMEFSYIQIDNLASLICVSVFEAERDGAGGSVGPRTARKKTGGYVANRRGSEAASISCPIRWDTLKCNMSVANAVLGSMTGGLETEMNQYQLYLRFSKSKVSFSDWKKFNQMIIISPSELLGGGLGLVDQQVSLSISFQFERCACDTMLVPRDWCRNGDDPRFPFQRSQRGLNEAINYTGRLWFMHQEAVKLSAGQCGIEQISFTADEASTAFRSAQKTLETQVLDQFIN